MRVYVKDSTDIHSFTVENIFQQLSIADTHHDNPSYIQQHVSSDIARYFTIAYFDEDKTPYLLTIQEGKPCRFVLRKDTSSNTYSPFSCCFEYGVEKIPSHDGTGLVDGHQKIFLPTPINSRFTNDRAFSISARCIPTREEVDAVKEADASVIDDAMLLSQEDEAEDTFSYLEDSLLTYEQQRRLFYGRSIPGCDQFLLTLYAISENFDDPAKILSAVLLNDDALVTLNLTSSEKKYIESKWLPFFELDRIDEITDMPGVTIGTVLFYYQFCVFRELRRVNPTLEVDNDTLRDYPDEAKQTLLGHLPSHFVSDSLFWEKPPKPVDPTLVSPNAEIIQALSLIFGINPGSGYETKVAFIQSVLRQYSIEQLSNIFNALQDYKATLADAEEQSHFRLDYQAAYNHLQVVYPIPARISSSPENVSRPLVSVHDQISRLLNMSLDSVEYNNDALSIEDNRMARLGLSTLVNMSITEAESILSAYRIEKKIKENPVADIRLEELIYLIRFFSQAALRELLSGEIAKKVVALLKVSSEFSYLLTRLNPNESQAFLSLFFEHVIDDNNIYSFFKCLSATHALLCAKYVPVDRFAAGIKQKGDLINLVLYVPSDKRPAVIEALLQDQRLSTLMEHVVDFQTLCLYCNFGRNESLRARVVEQAASSLPRMIHNAREFVQLWNQTSLTDREVSSCMVALIPSLPRYFHTVSEFNVLNNDPTVPEKIKQKVYDSLLGIFNARVTLRNAPTFFNPPLRPEPVVFLSGLNLIGDFFNGDGGSSMKTYLNSFVSTPGITIENLVAGVEHRMNQLSTVFTLALRLAVNDFISKWKQGNVQLNIATICENAKAQVRSQAFSQRSSLLSPPFEVVIGSSSYPGVSYRYQ